MSQNFLTKKIDGARLLDEACKAKALTDSEDLKNLVLQKLQEIKCLDLFFSKNNIHAELVGRCEGPLKLLISESAITEDALTQVWGTASQSEDTYNSLLAVLQSIAQEAKPSQLSFLIGSLASRAKKSVTRDELELMSSLVAMKGDDDAVL